MATTKLLQELRQNLRQRNFNGFRDFQTNRNDEATLEVAFLRLEEDGRRADQRRRATVSAA